MLGDEIKALADAKGLVVETANNGFSVKKDGVQIRFCFDHHNLISFLESFGLNGLDESQLGSEVVEESVVKREVVTKTIIEIREVVVKDFDMPFMSMIVFMVKWSLASIPAFIILSVFIYFVFKLLDLLGLPIISVFEGG